MLDTIGNIAKSSKASCLDLTPAQVQEECDRKNKETSAKEVADFLANPPERYFAYVKCTPGSCLIQITTWVGELLGEGILNKRYKDNFGGTRVSISVKAINGREYYGTYFESSGDYCRLKLCKSKSNKGAIA